MEVDQQGVPEGWSVVTADIHTPVAQSTPGPADARRPIASGRGTQFDPTLPNRAIEASVTPLAHPTGIAPIDNMTSPVGLASLAAGGVGVARAGIAGGGMAALKAAAETASPQIKYEIARQTLRLLKVPEPLAIPAAMAISGYKRGGTAARGPSAVPESVPAPAAAAPTAMSSGPQGAVGAAVADTAAASVATKADLGQALKQLASQGHLTPVELDQSLRWVKQGVPAETIMSRIEDSRKLTGVLGTATPDEAAAKIAVAKRTRKF